MNALNADMPSLLSGIDTASPSGKFCSPMPIARFTALAKLALLLWPTLPKPTPTAIPSGRLCSVMAITSSKTRRKLLVLVVVGLSSSSFSPL
ncbi:hypothetical protein GQ600_14065 [Phytophthora cactorum]|nr:hypothetical protein GQ600_14065 [Phytophthora cactorum]